MSETTHKKQIIDAALEGLHQGGFSQEYAYLFTKLFDRVYTSGYNERQRVRDLETRVKEQEELIKLLRKEQ
jgi:acyl-[acyl carrier protein]--UDP-N-acetylglucosamine O-acyltransferase